MFQKYDKMANRQKVQPYCCVKGECKMSFKVLWIYPNPRLETIVPPGIALLSTILRNNGVMVDLFDTTDYPVEEDKDYERLTEAALGVRPAEHRKYKYADRDPWKDLNEKINSFQPNLIAMSCTESTFLLGLEFVRHIEHHNHRDMPVILGGSFATANPKRALDFPEIDIVCDGEGEKPLPELCRRMERGEPYKDIAGLCFRGLPGFPRINPRPSPVNPDGNPINLAIDLFDPDRLVRPMNGKLYRMVPIENIRGCMFHCGFCNSRNTGSRVRSMKKVREEAIWYRDNFAAEYLFLWADTFLQLPRRALEEFCEISQDIKLPFWIQTRVETVERWRLEMLIKAGLDKVAVGIENGHEDFRRKVVMKEFTNQRAVEALTLLADMGIKYNTNNMVGYPHETPAIALETIELNRRFPNVDTTNCFTFTPYYGTPARDEAVQAGFMDSNLIAPGNAEDSVLTMPQFSKDEIRRFRLSFAMKVKFPKSRWSEIDRATENTPESKALFQRLHEEYQAEFFGTPAISF